MDFFDKLGKKISDGYNAAAEKTKEVASETKLKFSIADCNDKMKDEYVKIGEKVYDLLLNHREEELAMRLIEEFKTIDALKESVKNYKNELMAINHKKRCSNCGEEFDENANHCPKCGTVCAVEEPKVFEAEIVNKDDIN